MGAAFDGMSAWVFGTELIECEVDGELIDLHNTASVRSLLLEFVGGPRLTLGFRHEDGRAFKLFFAGVTDLEFRQENWPDHVFVESHLERTTTFNGLDHVVDPEDGVSAFEVSLLYGDVVFRARLVAFRWTGG